MTVRGDPRAREVLVRAMGEPPAVPMLVDGGTAIWDRRRILAHLEATYGAGGGPLPDALPDWISLGDQEMGGSCRLESGGGDPAC